MGKIRYTKHSNTEDCKVEPWEVQLAKDKKGDNRDYLVAAHEALYSTYIIDEDAAKHRGVAIRAINDMAKAIGLDYARTD